MSNETIATRAHQGVQAATMPELFFYATYDRAFVLQVRNSRVGPSRITNEQRLEMDKRVQDAGVLRRNRRDFAERVRRMVQRTRARRAKCPLCNDTDNAMVDAFVRRHPAARFDDAEPTEAKLDGRSLERHLQRHFETSGLGCADCERTRRAKTFVETLDRLYQESTDCSRVYRCPVCHLNDTRTRATGETALFLRKFSFPDDSLVGREGSVPVSQWPGWARQWYNKYERSQKRLRFRVTGIDADDDDLVECTTLDRDIPTGPFDFTVQAAHVRALLDDPDCPEVRVLPASGADVLRRGRGRSRHEFTRRIREHLDSHWIPREFAMPPLDGHAFVVTRPFRTFQEHVVKFHRGRKYKCLECPETFHTDMRLFEHMHDRHGRGAYVCPKCKRPCWRIRRVECTMFRRQIQVKATVDLCTECFKVRPEQVYTQLLKVADVSHPIYIDQPLNTSMRIRGCLFRPDVLWPVAGRGHVIVEVDEKQHRSAAYTDNDAEPVRLRFIHERLGGSLIVFRVNPDAYWPHGMNVSAKFRHSLLLDACRWAVGAVKASDSQIWVGFIGYDAIPESYERAGIKRRFVLHSRGLLWVMQRCYDTDKTLKQAMRELVRHERLPPNVRGMYDTFAAEHFDGRQPAQTFEDCLRQVAQRVDAMQGPDRSRFVFPKPTIVFSTSGTCPKLAEMHEPGDPAADEKTRLLSLYKLPIGKVSAAAETLPDAEAYRNAVDCLYAAHALLWEAATFWKPLEVLRVHLVDTVFRERLGRLWEIVGTTKTAQRRALRKLRQNRFD